jgi:hypothetical protein
MQTGFGPAMFAVGLTIGTSTVVVSGQVPPQPVMTSDRTPIGPAPHWTQMLDVLVGPTGVPPEMIQL